MQKQNDKLASLLKQWPGVEPHPTFDQDVLRRIRIERAAAVTPVGLGSAFLDFLAIRLISVQGMVAAVAAAIVIGFLLACTTPAREMIATDVTSHPDVSHLGMLSENYLAMARGGRQ